MLARDVITDRQQMRVFEANQYLIRAKNLLKAGDVAGCTFALDAAASRRRTFIGTTLRLACAARRLAGGTRRHTHPGAPRA